MTAFPIPASIDLAGAIIDYLSPLVGIVDTTVPNPRPSRFTVVSVSTMSREDVVLDESLVTLECYGPSELASSELGRIAQAAMLNWESNPGGGAVIYRVRMGGLRWLPDPDGDLPRHILTGNVWHRANLSLSTSPDGAVALPATTRADFTSYFE